MFSYAKITDVPWTGQPQGIGPVTVKDGRTGLGTLSVVYNGIAAEPVDSGAEYKVQLIVAGGVNYEPAVLDLGKFTIQGKNYISVASGDREIPGSVKSGQAAVAPVAKVSAGVSVGPNPVSSNGTVNVFWNGSKSVKGKIFVFSATGSKVAALNVSGTGKIGTWNVRGVAEGTYLVKGVVKTANGEKVKVSTVVGVTR
jgi:hypothetical protein